MPKKILIVDDDALLLEMYAEKLGREGFQVETALSGRKGLEKARGFKPDLILLDILMPSMDGFQVLEKLKSDPATKGIPVVFLTNLSEEEENVRKGFGLGAAAYFVKARFRPAEIIEKIKEILGLVPKK